MLSAVAGSAFWRYRVSALMADEGPKISDNCILNMVSRIDAASGDGQ